MIADGVSKSAERAGQLLATQWLSKIGVSFEAHRELADARELGLYHRFDLILPSEKVIIEIQNCFWDGHGCQTRRAPGLIRRRERNRLIDMVATQLGWKIIREWECQIIANPSVIATASTH